MIDFDKLAHEVQEPGKPAWRDVVDFFGAEIVQTDKRINRDKLAAIVFNQPEKLKRLNTIVHPRIFEEWCRRLEEVKTQNPHAIILADVPLLFEGGMQHLFDLTILVMVEPAEQITRLIARNAICRADAELRLLSQMPIRDKITLADIVIDNQCDIQETEIKVDEVWRGLLDRERNKQS